MLEVPPAQIIDEVLGSSTCTSCTIQGTQSTCSDDDDDDSRRNNDDPRGANACRRTSIAAGSSSSTSPSSSTNPAAAAADVGAEAQQQQRHTQPQGSNAAPTTPTRIGDAGPPHQGSNDAAPNASSHTGGGRPQRPDTLGPRRRKHRRDDSTDHHGKHATNIDEDKEDAAGRRQGRSHADAPQDPCRAGRREAAPRAGQSELDGQRHQQEQQQQLIDVAT